ncbi:hypothetical protein NECAME_12747 [Necator americanus]|uniref:Uncharacterized protein n=1 Tax=Necator americanus TaxID=51031 RepID=W2T0L2_NECAM|nr:hypothetical protein NECAME_12747 [Necator americanus]ETN74761.1 hypothetical protein NECAME_12747 [Necator americanus]
MSRFVPESETMLDMKQSAEVRRKSRTMRKSGRGRKKKKQQYLLTHSVQAATMYRPVDTIPPKVYEAPPPYECFVPPPPDQARNDWNCIVENEVNGSRNLAPFT